ncbi:MAG: pseudouridine synthase [Dokdonella sp.]
MTFASQRPPPTLSILYSDEHLLLVDKPPGMAVHRSRLVHEDGVYLVDLLRDQLKADGHSGSLHPIHRLDRGTSGVLLVGRDPQVAAALGEQFMSRDVEKTYLAVCRGWPDETGEIVYPLPGVRETSERKPALTRWKRLATVEVPIAISRYPQQRYALIEVQPETGRYRQIRRHFSHIHHHLIGDTSHGRGDHNRLFREHYGVHRMLLHAHSLRFAHPISGEVLTIEAPLDAAWTGLMERFGWGDASASAITAGHRDTP